ncbi:MAG: CDP-alcohol phosphatidyltransferase family protein [Woeseiaceae bacterium]|nr:CDP-alcohol phosphatidyltransferase family protein [Woeseiaceae bacterium]
MSLSWLPNAITGLRILLIPPVLWFILSGSYREALALFVIAGFSDGLDGFLARRYGWHSRLGGLLDPLADKLLVAGMFVTLAYVGAIPLWLTLVVVGRDVTILGGATAYNLLIRPVQGEPTMIGKFNTAITLTYVFMVLCRLATGWPPEPVLIVLGAATFVTVAISGIDYVVSWSGRARKEGTR